MLEELGQPQVPPSRRYSSSAVGGGGSILVLLPALQPGRDGLCHDVPNAAVRAGGLHLERTVQVRIQVECHLHGSMIQVAGLLARWATRHACGAVAAARFGPRFTSFASALKHREGNSVPSGVEPVTAPLEAVDAAGAQRTAQADALVVTAWSDHHAEIFAFLVRTTRDPEVAEDLLSEAYLRLTREARAGRTPDNVRAWLYRVGANLAVSRGRRISAALRGVVRLGNAPPAPPARQDAPEAGYLGREGRAGLLGVLADLDPSARAALLLSSARASAAPRSPPRSAAPRPRPAPCSAGPGCGSGAGSSRRRPSR